MRPSLLVVVGVLAVSARASADDDFRASLVEHRVRSGFVDVYGTINVAYGRGLMNPERSVTLPFDMSKPPIRELNMVARFDEPLTLAVAPRSSAPVELFGISRVDPGHASSTTRTFGSVTVESPWGPSDVFRRIEANEVRIVPRATSERPDDTHFRQQRAVWPVHNGLSKKGRK